VKIGWEPHKVARAVQGRGRPPLQPSSIQTTGIADHWAIQAFS